MPLGADGSSSAGSNDPSSSGSGRLAVALYGGDAVRVVHATVQRQAAQALPLLGTHAAGDGEEDSSTSNFPSPDVQLGAGSPGAAAAAALDGGSPPLEAAGQRAPAQPPAATPQSGSMQQQQQRGTPQSSGRGAGSPLASPWPRQSQRQRQPAPSRAAPPEGHDGELEVQYALVSCTHAVSRGWHPPPPSGGSGGSGANDGSLAAVSISIAPEHLDLEACIYAALQQQGLPASDLLDYASALVQASSWQGRDGLLLLAVLRLRRPQPGGAAQQEGQQQERAQQQQSQAQQPPQAPSRSACVLLHVAAASGVASAVEWLEPPYPWHSDLSAYMVQQTALAGGRGRDALRVCRLCGCNWTVPAVHPHQACSCHNHLISPLLPTCRAGFRKGARLFCRILALALGGPALPPPPAAGAVQLLRAGHGAQPGTHCTLVAAAGHSWVRQPWRQRQRRLGRAAGTAQ